MLQKPRGTPAQKLPHNAHQQLHGKEEITGVNFDLSVGDASRFLERKLRKELSPWGSNDGEVTLKFARKFQPLCR